MACIAGYIIYTTTDVFGTTNNYQWSHLVRWIDYGETIHDEFIDQNGVKQWLIFPGLERTRALIYHTIVTFVIALSTNWEPSHVNMVLRRK